MELNKTFTNGLWSKEINVSDFVSKNIAPYTGDASFLQGPTERTKRISEESARCYKLLNDFISNNLGVSNLSFDVKKYNDIIGLVSEIPEYEKLRKQYFL